MPKTLCFIALTILLLSACTTPTLVSPTPTPEPSPTPEGERAGWKLVWQDEFNGDTLDLNNWTFDLGANGWGNAELEEYTNHTDNVRVENGNLIIEARQDETAQYGYSSARIKTQDLQAWQYGRVEGRLKLPQGQGIWPAFWMLGNDISTTAMWPNCGEIDIMEFIGKEPNSIYNTAHGPGYSGAKGLGSHTDLPQGSLQNDFHVYAIEWESTEIRWYIDDAQVFKVSAGVTPGKWVFDHPFFIILNVAVGGGWPGYPDDSTLFPQQMLVDYVRVYQQP
jgi:beta-glucanase (GH16 family)